MCGGVCRVVCGGVCSVVCGGGVGCGFCVVVCVCVCLRAMELSCQQDNCTSRNGKSPNPSTRPKPTSKNLRQHSFSKKSQTKYNYLKLKTRKIQKSQKKIYFTFDIVTGDLNFFYFFLDA